jgi:uncharacterized protein YbaP (TraB family)
MPTRRRLLIAALGLPISAPFTPAASAPATPTGGFDRGLLWRIGPARETDAGANTTPSHLYGTLHIDDAAAKAFAAPVRAALRAARRFMPELRSDAESGRAFMAATQLPPGQSLRLIAGDALFARVAELLAQHHGLPPRATERLKPWAAYLQLSQPSQPPVETVDAALERLALGLGKPVEPLEALQAQIDALEAVPPGSQLTLLEGLARRHGEAMAGIARLGACYLDQDLSGLLAQERAIGAGDPALQAALDDLLEQIVHRRSERMAARLWDPLRAGGAFVAVGALHLQGERGLPSLLAQAGWRVERVRWRDARGRPQ